MRWLMTDIKKRNFFFIDSRTTDKTVAFDVATTMDVMTSSRDVFLDNEQSIDFIDTAFKRLLVIARKKGTAIGIGHPHRTTLAYLEKNIPRLTGQGIRIIPVSALLRLQASSPLTVVSHTVK
jgi:polysaccharide deacetylase 2 family uncharacterized protein YibQ